MRPKTRLLAFMGFTGLVACGGAVDRVPGASMDAGVDASRARLDAQADARVHDATHTFPESGPDASLHDATQAIGEGGRDAPLQQSNPPCADGGDCPPCESGSVGTCLSGPCELVAANACSQFMTILGPNAYWLDGNRGNVMTAPTTGGVPTPLSSPPVATLFQRFRGLAVDATGIYGAVDADFDASAPVNTPPGVPTNLFRLPADGGAPTPIAYDPSSIAPLTSDGTSVFWADADGELLRVPNGGGTPVTLASGISVEVSDYAEAGLKVDATSIYWLNYTISGNTAIMKLSLDGGTPTTLASTAWPTGVTSSSGWRLAVDATNVYWTVEGVETQLPGALLSVPIAGGATTTLATGLDTPAGVVSDGTNVYWVSYGDGTVLKMPVAGGEITTLASGQSQLYDVAIDATHVYWSSNNNVLRTPK